MEEEGEARWSSHRQPGDGGRRLSQLRAGGERRRWEGPERHPARQAGHHRVREGLGGSGIDGGGRKWLDGGRRRWREGGDK